MKGTESLGMALIPIMRTSQRFQYGLISYYFGLDMVSIWLPYLERQWPAIMGFVRAALGYSGPLFRQPGFPTGSTRLGTMRRPKRPSRPCQGAQAGGFEKNSLILCGP